MSEGAFTSAVLWYREIQWTALNRWWEARVGDHASLERALGGLDPLKHGVELGRSIAAEAPHLSDDEVGLFQSAVTMMHATSGIFDVVGNADTDATALTGMNAVMLTQKYLGQLREASWQASSKAGEAIDEALGSAAMNSKRHHENRDMKRIVLDYYNKHMHKFDSKNQAAERIYDLRLVPVKYRTIRDWLIGV
jgi:hypothetical protein